MDIMEEFYIFVKNKIEKFNMLISKIEFFSSSNYLFKSIFEEKISKINLYSLLVRITFENFTTPKNFFEVVGNKMEICERQIDLICSSQIFVDLDSIRYSPNSHKEFCKEFEDKISFYLKQLSCSFVIQNMKIIDNLYPSFFEYRTKHEYFLLCLSLFGMTPEIDLEYLKLQKAKVDFKAEPLKYVLFSENERKYYHALGDKISDFDFGERYERNIERTLRYLFLKKKKSSNKEIEREYSVMKIMENIVFKANRIKRVIQRIEKKQDEEDYKYLIVLMKNFCYQFKNRRKILFYSRKIMVKYNHKI